MAPELGPNSRCRLLELPAELIHLVMTYLSAHDLLAVSTTCRTLFSHACNDILWANLVNENLPEKITTPGPFSTFRELYAALYPYWFIPRYRIWFSDTAHTGRMIVARYDNRRGVIEAYRVVAERSPDIQIIQWDDGAVFATFDPRVRLWFDDPVVNLKDCRSRGGQQHLPGEVRMPMVAERIFSSIAVCAATCDEGLSAEIAPELWPPVTIPSAKRVYRNPVDELKARTVKEEKEKLEHVCNIAFRLIQFVSLGPGYPVLVAHNNPSTFATLHPSLYTPTKEKPYQGIWVGDYSMHGCEFLLFLQRDEETLQATSTRQHYEIPDLPEDDDGNISSTSEENHANDSDNSQLQGGFQVEDQSPGESGRLEAIKLTGDPNVPRGEISFVARDIGRRGTVRIADREPFKGARMVRSWGHVAHHNFEDPQWIKSQLILLSHDCVAHYWEAMHHISYFRRVNIDKLFES
ncbi:hypothetical protein VTN49DRAFT_4880 [Thermomyces lanuginosus]|uniref:uncharacterized protein n=1 Tax=Thermomyces lanuginosus TaxID=5541 RepID=UPI003744141D